ncbi:MAG: NTP transferase domain-containing protein [Clostridia bacterium]|nr:NTP transferase domain-containing protein [Clostridia bacterium]
MDKNTFEVLRFLAENGGEKTQRMISEKTGLSLGSINKIVSKLKEISFIDDTYFLTQKGLDALAPYEVKNAIVLAAGMSTRFIPFSYEKPKGLTVVKGEVLIERQIRQLQEAGVKEIIVVLGHMMEKFLYLVDKFNVKVVLNKDYRYKNTHSSLYYSRKYLKNSYICCADNYFSESVFHRYEFHSLYSTIYMEGVLHGERGVFTNAKGLIVATQRPAVDQWIMNGYAYFNQEFSNKFRPILESVYDTPGTDGLYWEQIYAEHVDELPLYEKRYTSEQVMEFDSVAELEAFDPDYIKHNSISLVKNICDTFNCTPGDIHDIRPIPKGYTNRSFKFICNDQAYVYRTPGSISSEWIDRKSEKTALENAKQHGIDDSYIYADEEDGWKISHYIDVTDTFNFSNPVHIKMLCQKLRDLYRTPLTCNRRMDYMEEAIKLLKGIKAVDAEAYQIASEQLDNIKEIDRYIKADNWPIQMVHNDLYEDNILLDGDNLYLIDWEYAGDTDIGYDVCKLFVKNNAEGKDIDKWLSFYFERMPTPTERKHIIGCAAVSFYYWYIWALYMIKHGNDYSELMLNYITFFNRYQKEFFSISETIN